jgi:hypothetical protein
MKSGTSNLNKDEGCINSLPVELSARNAKAAWKYMQLHRKTHNIILKSFETVTGIFNVKDHFLLYVTLGAIY